MADRDDETDEGATEESDAPLLSSDRVSSDRVSPDKLSPARPDVSAQERAAWAPRIPWKWIIIGVVGIGAVFGSYFIRRDQRQEALRAEMLRVHDQELTEVSERYLAYVRRIEGLVEDAGEMEIEESWADPRLNFGGLRSGEGLYLRIPADWTDTSDRIEGAARAMDQDAITRCLSLSPMSVRGLYESGYFLTPEWVDSVRDEEEMMELRVLDDQLGRHIQVDAPVVMSMMQADWFLLVLETGDSRRTAPVKVFLWDLRRNQLLMRAQVQAAGVLVAARARFEGVETAATPGRQSAISGGAADCSIASQLRALTGAAAGVEFDSTDAILEAEEAAQAEEAAREAEEAALEDDSEEDED